MKRWMACALAAIFAMCVFSACTGAPASSSSSAQAETLLSDVTAPTAGATIAMVAGEADLEGGFAQSAWTAINRFAGEENLTCGLYRVAEGSSDAAMATMELAERGGAELAVFVGEQMREAAARAQLRYPDINFILLGMPAGTPLQQNGVLVRFSAEQGGWLAGYATIYEHHDAISYFDTGEEGAARYAMGFLLGAEAAAKDLAMEEGAVRAYPIAPPAGQPPAGDTDLSTAQSEPANTAGSQSAAQPEQETDAAQADWAALAGLAYDAGAQVLFANSRALQDEALSASRAANALAVGLSPDMQPAKSVITTVVFDPKNILSSLLGTWQAGRFPGGGEALATVSEGGVALSMADGNFSHFTQFRYDELVDRFKLTSLPASIAVKLAPHNDGTLPTPDELSLSRVVLADMHAPPPDSAEADAADSAADSAGQSAA